MIQNIILKIEGMACENCVASINKALQGIEGIEKYQVSLEDKKATISFDDDKTTSEECIEAIEDIGFEAYL